MNDRRRTQLRNLATEIGEALAIVKEEHTAEKGSGKKAIDDAVQSLREAIRLLKKAACAR